ncbi:MAG: hypothetical protein ACLR7N_11990 [Roseburia hominis]
MEYNRETRDAINDVVNHLFRKNGIVISEDTALRLTVDPYDYYIHAEGVDEEMAGRIEAALNQWQKWIQSFISIYIPAIRRITMKRRQISIYRRQRKWYCTIL